MDELTISVHHTVITHLNRPALNCYWQLLFGKRRTQEEASYLVP